MDESLTLDAMKNKILISLFCIWPLIGRSHLVSFSSKTFYAGDKFICYRTLFENDKAILNQEGKKYLDSMAAIMHKHTDLVIEVGMHIDINIYNNERVTRLLNNRADSITAYLISKGIEWMRLRSINYSSSMPQYFPGKNKADSMRARSLNRPVEFRIMESQLVQMQKEMKERQKKPLHTEL